MDGDRIACGGNGPRHDAAGSDYRSRADPYAGEDSRSTAHPHV